MYNLNLHLLTKLNKLCYISCVIIIIIIDIIIIILEGHFKSIISNMVMTNRVDLDFFKEDP